MGSSLASRFEWISGSSESQKLATSIQNQELLYELVGIIQQISQKYPSESKSEFKRPLQWSSSLSASQIATSSFSSLFNVQLANSK